MRQIILAAAAALGVAPASAEIAPGDVVFADGAVEQPLAAVAGDPEKGLAIMINRGQGNCFACHQLEALPDIPFPGDIAPMLDGAADRWSEAQLRGIVSNAKMTFDGTFMPAFYKTTGFVRPGDAYTGKAAPADLPPILNGEQIEHVVAYLMTLK